MQIDLYVLNYEVQKEILNTVALLLVAKCRGSSACPCIECVECPIGNVVNNKEQTDAIMDIIRPLQRVRTMALERLANICCRGDEYTIGTHIECPFSNRECYEITAKRLGFLPLYSSGEGATR